MATKGKGRSRELSRERDICQIMEAIGRTLIILGCFSFAFSTKVPVLLWSSSRSFADLPQSNAGKTVLSTDFTQQYLKPLTTGKDGNLVVFMQDKLSLQDFTQHADVYNPESDGGVFKNIKGFMDDLSSVSLPSVHLPGLAVDETIKKFKGKVHQVKGQDITKIGLDTAVPNLIIVTLNSVSDSPTEAEGFKKNDEAIAKVIRHLTKRDVKYTALYTARTSQAAESSGAETKRKLLSTQEVSNVQSDVVNIANGTLINSTCLLMYMRSITVVFQNKTYISNKTDNVNKTSVSISCSNNTANLNFGFKADTDDRMTLSMHMAVGNVSGYWSVVEASLTVKGQTNDFSLDSVSAPKGFSYHCSSLGKAGNSTGANITVSFDGFQLQPFGVMNYQFSDGWDCIPFFTEVIWMGIVSMAVVLLILLHGFTMLTSVTTQDRFDDPKGKTITVNVNE
ncbi:V-type proton ATPase subunit S1-like [Saccostrea echinata]|uniref:V-type proton ATPase subunit S1-like n=1 Tax=Saccostrea echinata TaxID=191078 RepID=UPI002A82E706|nr:V-type proton ATPase subunit S1-like [Saccostrea echinata]